MRQANGRRDPCEDMKQPIPEHGDFHVDDMGLRIQARARIFARQHCMPVDHLGSDRQHRGSSAARSLVTQAAAR